MSRPSDLAFEREFGDGLEAWHPDCVGLAWARLYAEAQRARSAEVEKEAKLRETEQGHASDMELYATQADARIRIALQRAEKAEGERDEARATVEESKQREQHVSVALRGLLNAVVSLAPYPPDVAEGVLALVANSRAALGEKP